MSITRPPAEPVCRRCGARFEPVPGAPGDSCPACLLDLALAPGSALGVDATQFDRYRILTKDDGSLLELGRGSMGVTYKALDERLRLEIALKVITPQWGEDPTAQALFVREARAAARVRHPNVASVLFLSDGPDQYFYAMEFVAGQTLGEWMREGKVVSPALAIELTSQLARGLGAIHDQHIVHRDLKPSNVMVFPSRASSHAGKGIGETEAWQLKIIDFGLVRVVDAAATEDSRLATQGFKGTAVYASPEQCEEQPEIDGRADLYALGCMAWQMVTGAPPFIGRSYLETLNMHSTAALPVERLAALPSTLQSVLVQLLAKRREDRYPNAEALIAALNSARAKIESGEELVGATDLQSVVSESRTESPVIAVSSKRTWWIVATAFALLLAGWLILSGRIAGPAPSGEARGATAGADESRKSIAVLPFANLSSDQENEYFADGVHEDVINDLTKIRDLHVISRTSVQRFKVTRDRNVREIARELGVGSILEGTVRRSGNRVRVTAQLIDPKTAQSIWMESYDNDMTDVFAIQSQIAIAIASALRANLGIDERAQLSRPVVGNAVAYAYYLKARGLLSDLSDSRKVEAATVALQMAVEADPSFALAYAQLSMLHAQTYAWAYDHSPKRLALALSAAEMAMRLEPALPEGQLAMAVYYYRGFRDYARALPFFQKALAAMPGNADVLYEIATMERRQGRWNDAVEKFERVAVMAPLEPLKQYNIANTYFMMRRYDDAWRILGNALRRMPEHPALKQLKGDLFLAWKNDLEPMREDIATRSPTVPDPDSYLLDKIELMLYERKFDPALATLRQSNFTLAEGEVMYLTRDAFEAEILTQAGRTEEARPIWQRAAADLAPRVVARPADTRVRMAYALALAGAGADPASALREARKAAAEMSVELDAMDGTYFQTQLALVSLRTGQAAEAAAIVQRLQTIPSTMSEAVFNLSPAWEPLRALKKADSSKP